MLEIEDVLSDDSKEYHYKRNVNIKKLSKLAFCLESTRF